MKPKNGRPFFMVYQFFAQELGLRGAAKEVYAIIYGRYVSFDGVAKVSLREMMRLTGLTKQSVINALKALQEAGLIEKTSSTSKKSTYKILGIEISPDGKPVKILDQSKILTSKGSKNFTSRGKKIRPHIDKTDTLNKYSKNENSSINLESPSNFSGRTTL